MGTVYSTVYDGFLKQLRGDKEFFNYKNVSEIDVQTLVNDHCLKLLGQSIDFIYDFGSPQINFYNKDDVAKQFNIDLTDKEIGILSNLMYYFYMMESRNKLKILGLTFSSQELSVFSPSNERRSYEEMLNNIKKDNEYMVINYLNKDRVSKKLKCSNFG